MQSLTIGEKVKFFRQRAGLSQLKLEAMILASVGSISRLELDRVNPTKETLFAIAEALELTPVEVAYLFGIIQEVNLSNFQRSYNLIK